jgi:aryl-alcohol dehydrogenase-like predicted oxidoreductase
MNYRVLGRTGMKVSSLGLGPMMLGSWGGNSPSEAIRVIHTALDAGINLIDTADIYANGESEEIVGEALSAGRRENVVLATKVHGPMGDDPNEQGNSRRWIMRAVERSLRRLRTDWIDLYQIHRPDPTTDIDETLAALSDLIRTGKVRYIGSSTPPYSMIARGIERDVLPVCRKHGLGVLTWSPLAAGWLSGRYRKESELPSTFRAELAPGRFDMSLPENQTKLDAVEQLAELADEAGLTLVHMALAFVLEHPAITAAIIGPRTMEHLDSQLSAIDVRLPADVLDRIDEIVPPGTTFSRFDAGWQPPELEPAVRRRT